MRVLIVESSETHASSMELTLRSEGANVYVTGDHDDAVSIAKVDDYDIVIIGDVSPVSPTGLSTLRSLRANAVKSAVVVVANEYSHEDCITALARGADDYMAHPIHKDELVARIYAIIRRAAGHAESKVDIDSMCVDFDSKSVAVDGAPVHLTAKEYQILELLALRKGKVLTKETLLNHLYGGMDEPQIKIIDVFICKLRAKLKKASAEKMQFIETVWGRGYTLNGRSLAVAA